MDNSKIIAAVPFHVAKSGELTESSETGFHRLIPDLHDLGCRISQGDQTMKDALPSEIAQIELFHHILRKKADDFDDQVSELEERWRQIMSAFILSKYRCIDLQLVSVKKEDCDDALWEILGSAVSQAVGTQDEVLILTYQRKALAVADIHAIWLPASEPVCLDEIISPVSEMEDYERDLIYSYLTGLLKMELGCEVLLQRYIKHLEDAKASKKAFESSPFMDKYGKRYKLPQVMREAAFYLPTPAREVPYPFHKFITLTTYETTMEKDCLKFTVAETNETLTTFYALLPLSMELVEQMEQSKDICLSQITLNSSQFAKNKELEIMLELEVCKEKICYRKKYVHQDIRYAPVMPVVAVFPYVNLPDNMWSDYNVVLQRVDKYNGDDDHESIQGIKQIRGDQVDMVCRSSRQSKTNDENYLWYYAKKERLPKYIRLCETNMDDEALRNQEKEKGYLGSLSVGRPNDPERSQSAFNRRYYLAIDLGTSNTIMGLRQENDESINYDLIKDDIYMPLLKRSITAEAIRFAAEVYAPAKRRTGKFRTMGTVYRYYENGSQNHCYEQGCARFPEFTDLVKVFSHPGESENLEAVTDIKFGNTDKFGTAALQVYIENMLWLGALNAILHGADELEVRISYPREEVLSRMAKIWESVRIIVQDKCRLYITLKFVTEAEANYFYQRKYTLKQEERASITNDFGIIDIGHGTSDMNFYFHSEKEEEAPKQIQISVRYAGERLLTDTIRDYFQNHQNNLTIFKNIWNLMPEADLNKEENKEQRTREENGAHLIEEYVNSAKKIARASLSSGNISDHGLRFSLEKNQKDILITLLQDIGLRQNLSGSLDSDINKQFLLFMKFKYMNLFLIYTGILEHYHRTDSGSTFKLFLYGGGRHGIQTITGRPMSELNNASFGEAIKLALASAMNIPIHHVNLVSDDSHRKNEVVDGMLWQEKEANNRQVFSKREEVEELLESQYDEVTGNVWNKKLLDTLKAEYNRFISFYKRDDEVIQTEFLFEGEKITKLYWYIAIEEDPSQKSDINTLIRKNCVFFDKTVQGIWNQVSEDTENPKEVLYRLFSCKMSESLLLEHLR